MTALSTRWDCYLTQEPVGKVVWCEQPVPQEIGDAMPVLLEPTRATLDIS